MTQNRHFTLIILFLVVLPLVFSYGTSVLDEKGSIELSTSTLNKISLYMVGIAIFGCGLIVYLNHISKTPNSYWYSVPIALIIGLSLIFIVGHSVSNFGF